MTSPSPDHRRPHRHPHTVAVTAGRPERVVDAPLNPPVVFASTYVGSHDTTGDALGYGRYGNPTWAALEEAIGALEGGPAITFASGMAAAYAVLELVPAGAVVVIPHNCYLGVAAAVDERAARHGWTVRRVNVAETAEVLQAAEGADLVWIESPTNPTIEVADLPAIGAGLPDRARFVVDNTFATPLLQRPLESGADIVLHSGTKLIAGHSDVLLGALVTREGDTETFAALDAIRRAFGASPGPMEAYLALRGLRTLPLRLAQAQASAQVLAERMVAHPTVRAVRYPGLPEDPGHQVARPGDERVRIAGLDRTRRRGYGRRPDRRLPAVGVRDQPRRGRVEHGAPPALARRTARGAGGTDPDVGGHRARRGPVE